MEAGGTSLRARCGEGTARLRHVLLQARRCARVSSQCHTAGTGQAGRAHPQAARGEDGDEAGPPQPAKGRHSLREEKA